MSGRSALREPSGPLEFFLGLLAIASVGIFILPHSGDPGARLAERWGDWIPTIDVAICIVFGVDYLAHLLRAPRRLAFAKAHFYQPFAAIPLTTPVIADIQIFLVLIVTARFVRATNVVFGDRFVQSIFRRYAGLMAREISDAVMIRSVEMTRELTRKGRMARSVADALDRRRGEVHAIVGEALGQVPAWETFQKLPGADDLVDKGERFVVDAMLEVLRSERLNLLMANVMDDALEDVLVALKQQHPDVAVDALGPTLDEQG